MTNSSKQCLTTSLVVFHSFLLLAVAGASEQKKLKPAETQATDEQRLLATVPELEGSQQRFVSEGWMKPGQIVLPKVNIFSKKDFPRFGLTGEIIFWFKSERLHECSFYIVDGEVGTTIGDAEWVKLYNSVKAICRSPEKRSGDARRSAITWTVVGDTTEYEVKLTRRVGVHIERGLEILVKPRK